MTTSLSENPIPCESLEAATSSGQTLREARIRAGLSEADVASRLRLDKDTITNLEAENYEHLPAPAFVRGYLRSYAALVGVPSDPLIEEFNRRGLPPPRLKADITQRRDAAQSRKPVRLAGYGLLLGAIILTAMQLYNHNWTMGRSDPSPAVHKEQSLRDSIAVATPEGSTPGEAIPNARIEPAQQDTSVTPSTPAVRYDATSELSEVEPAKPLPEDPVPLAAPSPAIGAVPTVLNRVAQGGTVASNDATAEQPSRRDPTNSIAASKPAPPDRLSMRFAHDSWVEVHDKNGTRLYYRLAKAGETLALTGAAPFRVLLGFAKDVNIEYNGRSFDHQSFINPQGIARFSVGERSVAAANGRTDAGERVPNGTVDGAAVATPEQAPASSPLSNQ